MPVLKLMFLCWVITRGLTSSLYIDRRAQIAQTKIYVRLQLVTHVHMHRLRLRVSLQSSLSQLSSDTAQLNSYEMLATVICTRACDQV